MAPRRKPVRRSRRDAPHAAFGARLKVAREALELTPRDAAKLLKAKLKTYYSWESGDRTPRPRDLPVVAAKMQTTIGSLLGESRAA